MSVGPGKIRVFRSDDSGEKKAESPTRRKSYAPKPKKAPKPEPRVLVVDGKTPENRAAANGGTVSPTNLSGPRKPISAGQGKFAHSLDKRPEPLEAIRVKHRLVLNEKQRTRLEALFSAPNALASLLRAYPQRLVTTSDASVFLLSNVKPTAPVMAANELEAAMYKPNPLRWAKTSPPVAVISPVDDVA